ncbi:MAG: LysR substrate-binding domain-containing protein [Candidatus Puniceispirillaceae bacterium]
MISNAMRLEIDVLKTFIAVAETGSVKCAAERVARSPAAVSMQMKKLERLVGAPVFHRSEGAMRLSDSGDRLMPHAHRIIEANDTALAALLSPDIKGMVRIGLCLENIETRMPEILAGFSRVHPGVTVNINAGDAKDLSAMLATNALDIAILTTGGGVTNLENDRLLYEQPLVWATHKNSRRDGESPLQVAVAPSGCPWRDAALDALKRAGIEYRISYLSNVSESQLAAVRADLAVAALPASRVVNSTHPICVSSDLPELPYTRMVLRMSDRPDANTKALATQILSAFNRPV